MQHRNGNEDIANDHFDYMDEISFLEQVELTDLDDSEDEAVRSTTDQVQEALAGLDIGTTKQTVMTSGKKRQQTRRTTRSNNPAFKRRKEDH